MVQEWSVGAYKSTCSLVNYPVSFREFSNVNSGFFDTKLKISSQISGIHASNLPFRCFDDDWEEAKDWPIWQRLKWVLIDTW